MSIRFSINSLLLLGFVLAVPALATARLVDAFSGFETAAPAETSGPVAAYVLPEVVVTASPADAREVAVAEADVRALDRRPS